jgi:peptidoglycan/LPS O-acetylase OafA/YrhL
VRQRNEPLGVTSPVEPRRRTFFGGLESLRGVAALSVAAYHITWLNATYDWGFVRNAYLWVDFFFVLSGFVISHSYGDKIRSGRDFVRFLWLRLGRLYPLHLFLLLLFLSTHVAEFARDLITGHSGGSAALAHVRYYEIFTSLFLVQGLGFNRELYYNFPAWSISTELYTCVVFGLVAWCMPRRRWLTAALTSIGAFLLLLVVGDRSLSMTLGFVRCLGGFFLGVLTYQAYLYVQSRPWLTERSNVVDAALMAALVCFVLFVATKRRGYSDFLVPPFVAIIVLLVAARPESVAGRALMAKPLAWLGKVSYSVYMVHWLTITVASRILLLVAHPATAGAIGNRDIPRTTALMAPSSWIGTLFAVLTLAMVCAVSQLTFAFVEDPFRRRARRFADKHFADQASVGLASESRELGVARPRSTITFAVRSPFASTGSARSDGAIDEMEISPSAIEKRRDENA